MQPHYPLPAPLLSPPDRPRLYVASSGVWAFAHQRQELAWKQDCKESARGRNPVRLMEDPDRKLGLRAGQPELRAFPLPVERLPPAEFPAPLAHAQQLLALHSRTVRGMASQAETCLTLGHVILSLAARRSFDRK